MVLSRLIPHMNNFSFELVSRMNILQNTWQERKKSPPWHIGEFSGRWVNLKAVKRLAENEALEIFCSLEVWQSKTCLILYSGRLHVNLVF
jgi:phosphoribosyl-AMP cyclohydrolase